MKEEKKESSAKKGDKSDKKSKPKFKRTEVLHHDDGTQTVNMDPSEAGKPVSFSRPGLEEALAAIKEQHSAAPEEVAGAAAPASAIA